MRAVTFVGADSGPRQAVERRRVGNQLPGFVRPRATPPNGTPEGASPECRAPGTDIRAGLILAKVTPSLSFSEYDSICIVAISIVAICQQRGVFCRSELFSYSIDSHFIRRMHDASSRSAGTQFPPM